MSVDLLTPDADITVLHFTPKDFLAGHKSMYESRVGRTVPTAHACLLRCDGAATLDAADRSKAVHHCRQYDAFTTKAVMAAGPHVWDALNPSHIRYNDWLGFMAPTLFNGRALFATLTVKDLYDTDRIVEAKAHVGRVIKWLHGLWPVQLPTAHTGIRGLIELSALLEQPACTVAVDTEFDHLTGTVPGHHPLILFGLCWEQDGQKVVVQFDKKDEWPRVMELYREVVKRHVMLFQNCVADVPVLEFHGGPSWGDYMHIEDLMLAHAALYAGWPHDLKYLRSIGGHTNIPKVFREAAQDLATYNQADVYETYCIWKDLQGFVFDDAGIRHTYHNLVTLAPIHFQATQRGVYVNRSAVSTALGCHLSDITDALALAETYAGWPIPLTGKAFTDWLVTVEGVKPVRHRRTKKETWDKDAITTLRSKYLAVDTEHELKYPLRMDDVLARIEAHAHPLLECRALYSRVFQSYTHYVLPLIKVNDDGDAEDLT